MSRKRRTRNRARTEAPRVRRSRKRRTRNRACTMRFAVAHKTSTYLMVGFAYVALIAGGALGPLVGLGASLALIASWWWEPPLIRFERWSWLWTVLSLFALVYGVLTA